MQHSTVALIYCENYATDKVKSAIERGLSLLGEMNRFFRPGESILLKPNLLSGRPAEKAVTTHPSVFQAVAELCLEHGLKISYGDSPAIGKPQVVAQKAGLTSVAGHLNLIFADFETSIPTSFPEGHLVKQFPIAAGVLQADGLISLPKLKTHGLTRITGAVKNQFGCIPGLTKSEYHIKFPDADLFSQMLVDLTSCLKPRLYIMDGIIAMEGNGPGNGDPVQMSALLLSTDPVALDSVACELFEVTPDSVPTNKWGEKFGLGVANPEQITLVGDSIEAFYQPDFNVERGTLSVKHQRISKILKNQVLANPVINESRCTRCGSCVKVCPTTPKSVDFRASDKSQPPVHNYSTCIRCYCCQEVCPENAITLVRPNLGRIFQRLIK